MVKCGYSHTIIVTTEGLYSCGANHYGQLGTEKHPNGIPQFVSGIIDTFGVYCHVAQVSCGSDHTLLSTEDGLVFSWGLNLSGQLGQHTKFHFISEPKRLEHLTGDRMGSPIDNIISVSCGVSHSVLLDSNGDVFTFGSNYFGELGISKEIESTYIPQRVVFYNRSNEFIVKIGAGPFNVNCLTSHGLVYHWGLLRGRNCLEHQYFPLLIDEIQADNKFVFNFASGITHTIFLSDNNLSAILPTIIAGCSFEEEFNGGPLLKVLSTANHPDRMIQLIQERTLLSLHLQSNNVKPYIFVDNAYIKIKSDGGKNLHSTTITVTNQVPHKLIISACTTMDRTNRNNKIEIEPSLFRLSKNSSKKIKVFVFTSRKLNEPTYGLINFFIIRPEREKKGNNSNSIPLSNSHEFNNDSSSSLSSNHSQSNHSISSSASASSIPSHSTLNQLSSCKISSASHYFILCALFPKVQEIHALPGQDDSKNYGSLQLIRNLGTYIPFVLLQHFAENPQPPQYPEIQQFPAAILFLDISGFTSLNEKLAQLGAAGPELVSNHINSYFASLIKAVSEHGGDVLKFAGDALICLWGSKTEINTPLEVLTLRAIQCGFDIQTRLDKYDSNEGFSLTLHIGIGSGELYSLWVGSNDSWEYLVSGEPLAQLRTAVDNSKTGEVVVSKQSWELVKNYCEGEPRDNDFWVKKINKPVPITRTKVIKGWPRLDAEVALRCFIPKAVQVSIDSRQLSGWGNELRISTVLFVKLNTPIQTEDKKIYLATINQVLGCMQQIIFKYEGMVRQFLADDKGTVLIAAFGLPPYSHDDDQVRGIRTAIEIHQGLEGLGMDSSIGVTTGQVYCGSVGCPSRQEYAMVGDIVNLSARLMVAAYKLKIKVLCDQPTYEASNSIIPFTIEEPIMVKGKANAIPIFQPIAKQQKQNKLIGKRRTIENTQVFGNEPIKIQINEHLQRINDHFRKAKGTMLLEAHQGMGKSILIQYVMQIARTLNIKVCHGAGDIIQQNTPYYPWRTIITDILAFTSIDESFEIEEIPSALFIERIRESLDKIWWDSIPLFNDILPIHVEENELTKSLTQKQRETNLNHLMKNIIRNSSHKSSFLITIDDIHWLDSLSLQLLTSIANDIPLVALFCTKRLLSNESQLLQQLSRAPLFIQMEINPLSLHDSEKYLRSLFKLSDSIELPEEIIHFVRKAKGNPLYIREMCIGLLDSSCIAIDDSTCTISGDLNYVDLPGLSSIITTKLDSLSSSQQLVLKVGLYFLSPPPPPPFF